MTDSVSNAGPRSAAPTLAAARPRRPRRRARTALVVACCLLLAAMPGCATVTGLVTGAFTGCVDAPAQVYRHHRSTIDHNPTYWFYNVVLFFPIGFVAGPIAGMIKGAALDVQWLIDQTSYEKAFGTYRDPSIWRPFTIHW